MISSREILIYLAIIFKGDWYRIYNFAVQHYELPPDELVREELKKLDSEAVTILDPEYPEVLRQLVQPPFVLFYHGDISLIHDYENSLAIIGTRRPTKYGIETTKRIIKELESKYIIISGMALGIDSIAQETTLEYGGRTVAVLGSGINNCYISSLMGLYQQLKERHLIISEYPGNTTPSTINFPFRNRIIAALSKCLLVTEAKSKSGTSTTVGFALMGQTNVLAVPAPANEDSLCNTLIREGAALVRSGYDVMDEMDGIKYSVLFPPR